MRAGKTRIVDRAAGDGEADGNCTAIRLTPDGRYIAFTSSATNLVAKDRNGRPDSFVLDRRTGKVALVSLTAQDRQGRAGVDPPLLPITDTSISADGDMVAFVSAGSYVPGDTNGLPDAFVRTGVRKLLRAGDAAR